MLKREDLPENFGRDPPYVEKKILAGLRRTSKRKFWQGSAVRRRENFGRAPPYVEKKFGRGSAICQIEDRIAKFLGKRLTR